MQKRASSGGGGVSLSSGSAGAQNASSCGVTSVSELASEPVSESLLVSLLDSASSMSSMPSISKVERSANARSSGSGSSSSSVGGDEYVCW